MNWVLSDLNLGQVWDVDLVKNESVIKEVLLVAQGEMALEEFLKQVRETWQFYELDLVNYQNKCKLIKGWDDLFGKLKENMNQVTAMKLSPYYRVFEEEASTWEDKLNRLEISRNVNSPQASVLYLSEGLTVLYSVLHKAHSFKDLQSLRRLDRRSTPMGLPGGNLYQQ